MAQPSSGEVIRIALLIVVLGCLIAGSFWTLLPFLGELIWATTIVVATWPLLLRLQRSMGGRRWLATTIMSVVILIVVIAPIFYAVHAVLDAITHGTDVVREFLSDGLGPPPAWVDSIPVAGPRIAHRWSELAAGGPKELQEAVQPYAREAASTVVAATGGLGTTVLHLIITIVLTVILYSTGEIAARGLLAFGYRMGRERGERTIRLAGQAVRSVALGILVTALVQSILAGLALWITGVPRPGLLGALAFALGVAQIGPLPIMVAGVIWLYVKGSVMTAIVLLVLSIPIVALDNVLRPILIRRGVQLPMLLIIAGVVGGLISFGVIGLFVGPVILAAAYTLTKDWIAEGWPDDTSKRAADDASATATETEVHDIARDPGR